MGKIPHSAFLLLGVVALSLAFSGISGRAEGVPGNRLLAYGSERKPVYCCKYCGQKFSNIRSLTSNDCPRHPKGWCKGKHEVFEGGEQERYYCVYCGQCFNDMRSLTSNDCPRHPKGWCKGKHSAYEGTEKSNYTCKYCGQEFSTLRSLTSNDCPRHPDGWCKGKHSPVR